ncbi:MAG: recombinase family protein [Candidatus Methylomirabilales bacterium]
MRAALYIRVSTDQQVERGDSLELQRERLEGYARSKGWEVQGLYDDRGISARDTNRPAFQRLLSQLKTGRIDVVLVTKLDRAFRDTRDFLENTELFEEKGVRFACLDGDIDTTTPSGRVFSTIRAALAQFERETTAERVREVMLARAAKGLWNGGVVPYGLRWVQETKSLIPDSEEVEGVRQMFRVFLDTRSIRGTTHRLNASARRTRAGGLWSGTSVRRILGNPVYSGAQTYNKRRAKGKTSTARPKEQHIIVEGMFEPIIDRETFLKAQTLLEELRVKPPAKRSQYLLTRLIFCGRCGSKMYGYTYRHHRRQGKTYHYYRCWGHSAKGATVCPGNTIELEYLEDVIVAELRNISLDPLMLRSRLEEVAREAGEELQPLLSEQRRLQDELRRIDGKLRRLLELYEDALIGKEEFAARRAELDRDRQELETGLKDVATRLGSSPVGAVDFEASVGSLRDLAGVYEQLDFEGRRALLCNVLSRVIVGDGEIQYGVYLIPECMGARAGTPRTQRRNAPARRSRSNATSPASPARSWTGLTSTSTSRHSGNGN